MRVKRWLHWQLGEVSEDVSEEVGEDVSEEVSEGEK